MNQPQLHKRKIAASLLIMALLVFVNPLTAAVLFSDNFTFPSNPGGSQNMNVDINTGRQGGLLGTNLYLLNQHHHQAGNTGTDVGQPVVSDGNYVLVAVNGDFQSSINIASASTTTLTIQFDMYQKPSASTDWCAFSLRNCNTGDSSTPSFPVAGGNEFGFLQRKNGGVQVFQNGGTGGASGQSGWDTAGFAPSPHWKLVFTDTAGTGSAFVGNGSKVAFYNNNVLLGTITLSQSLRSSDLFMGWMCTSSSTHAGIDNLEVDGTQGPVQVTTDTQQGANPFTPSYTAETPSLIAGASPTTANGNFSNEGSGGTSVLTDGTIGTSGTIGGFATCGGAGAGSAGNTLIYALPNAGNGVDLTNIVTYSGWGDSGRFGQYYTVSYSTVAAPTTFIPITTVCYISGGRTGNNGGLQGAPASRVAITGTNGTLLASGAANIKFDFSTPPNAGNFNNGYQGYSEIIVQGTNTATPPPPPSGILTQDTLPGYAETVVGDQVIFTAGFSNFPPVSLQWQVIAGGTTNNVSAGVVNVINNDNVTSTLTLNNVSTGSSGYYRLKADNATNGAAASSYSVARQLVVGSTPAAINNVIVNYAAQTYPGSSGYVAPWVLDTANLNLIYGFTSGTGPGTFAQVGNFTGDGSACSGDATVLVDGLTAPITSVPNYAYVGGGTLISGAGQSVTYTLVTNAAPFGLDITNITVFGGWQDAGRDEQKFQVLYSTVQSPGTFVTMLTADYVPGEPDNNPVVSRTTLVPASGVMAHNVAALKINFNVSPQPKNGWEGYSEILVGGQPTAGFVPALASDVSPDTASDVVGGQLILTASFTGADSVQWKKNGINVAGATSATLTLNNLQLSDTGAYSLVASNAIGTTASGTCAVTVNPAPAATNNVLTAIATQTSIDEVFTPTWDTNALGTSLLIAATLTAGDGDFSGGTFGTTPTGGSDPSVLTDGTFGTIDFNLSGTHSWVTCIGSGTGVNNAQGGNFVTYTLPASANGYDLTNIMTAGGWNDAGRDQQSYTVSYATAANPTYFQPLAVVSYNPNSPVGYSMSRATLTPASGVLAANVVALQFDMTTPAGENGFSGYSEIAAYGSPSASAPTAGPQITAQHEESTDAFTLETPNLIAGQLPSSFGAGVFSNEGCTEAGLTDGILTFGGNANSASCGDDGTAVPWIIFSSATGWNLTNIVTYSLWHDYGRDGQFYNVSYSTLANPTTFLPLASVAYNPAVPHDGRASGNRIAITPAVGQTLLASNVFAVKFDFTPQGTVDFGWSGYTEIVLQGDALAAPAAPVVSAVTGTGGNLVLTGTGAANYGYTVVTATDLQTPLTNWIPVATGTTTAGGTFSNAIPVSAASPTSFFRVRMP